MGPIFFYGKCPISCFLSFSLVRSLPLLVLIQNGFVVAEKIMIKSFILYNPINASNLLSWTEAIVKTVSPTQNNVTERNMNRNWNRSRRGIRRETEQGAEVILRMH